MACESIKSYLSKTDTPRTAIAISVRRNPNLLIDRGIRAELLNTSKQYTGWREEQPNISLSNPAIMQPGEVLKAIVENPPLIGDVGVEVAGREDAAETIAIHQDKVLVLHAFLTEVDSENPDATRKNITKEFEKSSPDRKLQICDTVVRSVFMNEAVVYRVPGTRPF